MRRLLPFNHLFSNLSNFQKVSLFGSKVGTFEGVTIYESPRMGSGHNSAGIALPGYGIIVAPGAFSQQQDMPTVYHEFGHFLQARLTGWLVFYLCIGLPSLMSAWLNWHGKGHQNYWTEVWCNHLVRKHFPTKQLPAYRFPEKDISNRTRFWLLS